MLKSQKKPEIQQSVGVDKFVENFLVINRNQSKYFFNIGQINFSQKNVDYFFAYRRVLRLPVISRIVAAMEELGLLTSSSILRMDERTVA